MSNTVDQILQLKKEKNAIILAHYYVEGEIQDIADYVGDSYYLSKMAKQTDADVIVFAGVNFMADSAKILNPDKTVLLPDINADCPMAHMVTVERIAKVREMYDDLAVVCYINSSVELKACSDVIVTSANAVKVTKSLPNKNIFFIPDQNLGRYVAEQVPEKHFIYNDGYCHVHMFMDAHDIDVAKEVRPDIKVLAHPECNHNILDRADYIGSTSGIINYVGTCADKCFYVCTERGVLHKLKQLYPDRVFYYKDSYTCVNMKKNSLQKILHSLQTMTPNITVDPELADKALKPLERMLDLAK